MTGETIEPSDAARNEKFKEDDIIAMSLIVELVRDHLIPYTTKHDTSKKMYDALINLYTIKNVGQSMILKNELRNTRMENDDTVHSYFVWISQIRDQLLAIGETIFDQELVTTTLNSRKIIINFDPYFFMN